jgi:menaquinol-cytochrome c reductase iron-sulfur subunit
MLEADVKSHNFGRRAFISKMSFALIGMVAALVAIPPVGFLLGPLVRKVTQQWRPVGEVSKFVIGKTARVVFLDPSPLPWTGDTAQTAAWLRRVSDNEFVAFKINCTHLGCPVRWMPDANIFICPCHGGVYYSDGRVAAGPPLEPLSRYRVRVRNGQVEIRTGAIPFA